ncbi:alcohol oxidase [Violaceomyces palustris]|uniref:Alcohol oxidase n=1 Tax=Violaceomyces palustris TaxID=1673888 RepID=A0ACD0NMH6_9BASI|nr:alcohol oxidase [Violaceomyces palustris]
MQKSLAAWLTLAIGFQYALAVPFSSSSITSDVTKATSQSYDYIIAGGGLTGLAVASRLTEDPDVTVLVIEQGTDRTGDPRFDDVRTYGEAFCATSGYELDYCFNSTAIPWRSDEAGQFGLPMAAGKMLSGSGGLNGASWTHGAKTQYDNLPLLNGDASWDFDGIMEAIHKVEKFHSPDSRLVSLGAQYTPPAHGYTGLLNVSFAQGMFSGPPQLAHEASKNYWNMQTNPDVASGNVNGATFIPNMLDPDVEQERASPLSAFIKPIEYERNNLVILTGNRVTSLTWSESQSNKATGVNFQSAPGATVYQATANKEVLLAAGSQQSPKLLELSGVGDPAVLNQFGIPVRVANPAVGKNLQEQTKTTLTWQVSPSYTGQLEGSGPANSIAFPTVQQLLGSQVDAVRNSTLASLHDYAQELEQLGYVVNATATEEILRLQVEGIFDKNEGAAEIFYTSKIGQNGEPDEIGVDLWNLIILARGTIHIRSTDPWDKPIIEPHYFGHPLDLQLQTLAAKQVRDVHATAPLDQASGLETLPGLSTLPANASFEDWEDWVKQTFTSVWHPIATCSMMKQELGGCVDSHGKVYGVDNVRVIDASVLPVQLSAHLSGSLYGIAEKLSESIKAGL